MASSSVQPPYAPGGEVEPQPSRTALETVERRRSRPHFILSFPELKLLGLAGTGFFLDALYVARASITNRTHQANHDAETCSSSPTCR